MAKKVTGFSNETIRKTIETVKNAMLFYSEQLKSGKALKISVSKKNTKIGKVHNISTAPIITCGNCAECMHYCYAVRDIYHWGYDWETNSVAKARALNTAILFHNRDEFFRQIAEYCNDRKKHRIMRLHVSGEMIDYDYFCRVVELAKNRPNWIFWTYTKMHEFVNRYIAENGNLPENLSVMFSRWLDCEIENPHNQPEFHTVEEIPDGAKNVCCGDCQYCIANKIGCPYGQSMLCKLH